MKTLSNLTFTKRKDQVICRNKKGEFIGFAICTGIILLEVFLFVRAIR